MKAVFTRVTQVLFLPVSPSKPTQCAFNSLITRSPATVQPPLVSRQLNPGPVLGATGFKHNDSGPCYSGGYPVIPMCSAESDRNASALGSPGACVCMSERVRDTARLLLWSETALRPDGLPASVQGIREHPRNALRCRADFSSNTPQWRAKV